MGWPIGPATAMARLAIPLYPPGHGASAGLLAALPTGGIAPKVVPQYRAGRKPRPGFFGGTT